MILVSIFQIPIRPPPLLFPNMNRKIEDNEARKRENIISLQYYIANLLLVLEYACIWPVKSFSLFKVLLSTAATIVFILINFLLLFSEIVALTMSNDLKLFANIIGVISMHTVGLIKWCYSIWKNREIIDLVRKLEKCHVFCQRIDNSKEGYQIYRNEMEYTRKYSNFFICCWTFACIYGVLHWCANPLLLEWAPNQINSVNQTLKRRNLPYIGWYPINANNIYNYVCLYLIQIIGGISSGLGIICYDTFYVTMLMVICAQFQYINIMLMKIDFDKYYLLRAAVVLQSKLKNCVDCHTEIIKFIKMLQTFSGPTMFVQCIETLLIICLVSFETSMIKIAGLQIAQSVYSCGWELVVFEKKEQVDFGKQLKDIGRLVQTIMVRAQRSIVLTGGPFYVLSLETFRVPALLPGDHKKRVGCGLLTLSHAILSRQLHVLIEAPRIPRGVDSPRRLTSYYVMHTWHLKVEIRMHVVTLLESGRSTVTKMTER
ncbi:Putative odorant receptor 85c [Trachymyrmex septentrionalis]|uniref:Odorant receptor n=1 Tax=Trachymyrmex septentrionalis TaxID=34720 RepID=A0A195F6X4_9HYME|nr:Putative odorant receptor 85c [Trachymyrmex septentrionalis]